MAAPIKDVIDTLVARCIIFKSRMLDLPTAFFIDKWFIINVRVEGTYYQVNTFKIVDKETIDVVYFDSREHRYNTLTLFYHSLVAIHIVKVLAHDYEELDELTWLV